MRDWIERLVKEKYRTFSALADAIGMTDSGFGRAVKAGTFDLENLLRLANETGESPATVMRLAGKAEVNTLIEKLYGQARPATDPDAEKAAEMMASIRDAQAREGFLAMMRGYLVAQRAAEQVEETPAKQVKRHR